MKDFDKLIEVLKEKGEQMEQKRKENEWSHTHLAEWYDGFSEGMEYAIEKLQQFIEFNK